MFIICLFCDIIVYKTKIEYHITINKGGCLIGVVHIATDPIYGGEAWEGIG